MPSTIGSNSQRLLPASLEARLIGTLGRGLGVVLLLVLAAVWASLVSWSVTDPSLSHATGGPIRNALGAPGAIVADLLLQTLGLAAAIALLPPMIWAFEMTLSERIPALSTRLTFYPLAILALAGTVSALPATASWPITHGLGGILGDVIFDALSSVLRLFSTGSASAATCILLGGVGFAALSRSAGFAGTSLLRWPAKRHDARPAARGTAWSAQHEPVWSTAPARAKSLVTALGALRPSSFKSEPASRPVSDAREPILPGAAFANRAQPARPSFDDTAAEFDHDLGDDFANDEPEPEIHALDPDFDNLSRAIAERFAPAGARPVPREAVERAPAQQREPAAAAPGNHEDLPRFMRGQAPRPDAQSAEAPAAQTPPAASKRGEPQRGPASRGMGSSLLRAVAQRRSAPAFRPPAPSLLKKSPPSKSGNAFSQTVLRGTARLLEDVLADFGVKGEVRDVKPGPVVTLYELEPARGTKATRIMALADDIARSMSAASARVAVIPGRNVIGIELPNARRETVGLRELIESPDFAAAEGALPLTLGRSIGGEPVVADLARMPHLLVAGTTGSGKSVGVNAMILSILYRHTPDECRFLMIDPKMLELSVYNGIPHLLTPVVTEPEKAVGALNWVVSEMEERYKRMAQLSVRNIEAFNTRVKTARADGQTLGRTVQTGFDPETGQPIYEREEMDLEPMPYIVVVVDEFADLMITAGKDIETAVQRLAQKARASGIHLIMATQRPSVDIITGTIKANFPTRIGFRVASKIDSRTILNEQGAEQLLGAGDMLFTSGAGQLLRVHGPFVSDEEVEAVADHLRQQGAPRYVEGVAEARPSAADRGEGSDAAGRDSGDSLYDRAVALVLRDRKASTSYVQRRLSIGYNRAADLIERMEREGLISAPNHTGRREILVGDASGRDVA
ncbi:cell division protein FtsK [Hyphomicrobium nitrativorans NL23]|uniref:DNA translocase FtsK n=1 Tax=Hyphomicrobium nitrativorans NL23 TaxID=1029756 RepID=V5SD35_9HYPH|nr:DNA translocase FtsK 4TM domain-containing protein [Hyphomicrobium nitrativorans]AHB48443.1 cell division protein FtsK [Hyphomicrobium nitrativorans NL23]